MPFFHNPKFEPEWAVRDETRATETGFGVNGDIAHHVYNALVERARENGHGGSFRLLKDGEVVAKAEVPARE